MPSFSKKDLEDFQFWGFQLNILIGMASDRYIKQIIHRTHKAGDKSFVEGILPIESVKEYFEHFPILEIDYIFYRLLATTL